MKDDHQDLYALPADAIKEPPHTLGTAMRQIGPGLILAASIVGTGELINTTSLGAKAGFSLLWLILLSCVIKVFVQVELGRYAITHGKTTLAAFDTLPGPRFGVSWLCWLWLFMMLTTQAQIAAMEGTVGQAAHMAFPRVSDADRRAAAGARRHRGVIYLSSHEEHFWAAVTTLAAVLLLLSGGYRRLERITTVLVAAVTLFTVASVLILAVDHVPHHSARPRAAGSSWRFRRPRWRWPSRRSASRASVHPSSSPIPTGASKRATPATPAGAPKTPAWAHRARGWTRVMQLDAWVSMLVFTIATVAFYFLGRGGSSSAGPRPQGAGHDPDPFADVFAAAGGHAAGAASPVHVRRLLAGSLGRPVQDAVRGHGRQQPHDGRFPGLDSASGMPTAPQSAIGIVKLFCVVYPTLSLGLYYAFREPQALIKAGGIAQALMLPFIAGATHLPARSATPTAGSPRRSAQRRLDLDRLRRHHGVARLQHVRPGAAAIDPSGRGSGLVSPDRDGRDGHARVSPAGQHVAAQRTVTSFSDGRDRRG